MANSGWRFIGQGGLGFPADADQFLGSAPNFTPSRIFGNCYSDPALPDVIPDQRNKHHIVLAEGNRQFCSGSKAVVMTEKCRSLLCA